MAKDYTKANEIFAKLVEDPNVKPTALRYYSYSLFEAGDLQKSRAIFDRYFAVVAKDQIEANDYAYHGRLLLKLNEDSLATISLANSLALNANQADIATALAETYLKTKKYDDAIRTYKALIKSRPKPSAMDYFSIGRAYYYSEKFAPADSAFTKLTEMQPNVVASYFWKARSQSNLDPDSKAGLAKPAYEMVIEKALATPEKYKNELIEAYLYLGGYYAEKDDINKTREYFKKVIAIDPNHEQAKKALELLK